MLRAPQPKAAPAEPSEASEPSDIPASTAAIAAADDCFTEPIRLALMRATVDNDGYKVMPEFGEEHRIGGRAMSRWQRLGVLDDQIPTAVRHVQQRRVRADGGVLYHHQVTVPEPLAGLPRIGVRFALPAEFSYIRWLGRGPHENYPDRNSGALHDVWARESDELPYLVPQEFGLRTDCEWIEFVAPHSTLRIDVLEPATLHFSAVHHSPLQLQVALDTNQLERNADLIVHLDVAHRGLGTASCGPDVLEQYEVPAGIFEFVYLVRTVRNDN
jgi:beta-galactosidase